MSEEKEKRQFQVGLVKGASFRSGDGLTWRRGQIRTLPEGPQLDAYRKNPKFAVQGAPVRKDVQLKARTRADVRRERGQERPERHELVAEEPSKPAPPPVDSGSQIRDRSRLSGFTDRMLELAKLFIDAGTKKRDDLDKIARELNVMGPDGQPPEKAKNKQELVGWIRLRQGHILEQVAALESPLEEEEGDDSEERPDDDGSDLDDPMA